VSDSFKVSLSCRTVDASVLAPVSKRDSARLATFIADNPSLYAKFDRYKPAFDAIYNARIAETKGMTKRQVEGKFQKDLLLNELEIDPLLNQLGFSTQGLPRTGDVSRGGRRTAQRALGLVVLPNGLSAVGFATASRTCRRRRPIG
jgi:hypothetical protein